MIPIEYSDNDWGGYQGEFFLKTLSGSDLDTLDLLLRESIQNSYDAKEKNNLPVQYFITGKNLSSNASASIKNFLLSSKGNTSTATSLARRISEKQFCIEISDRNSSGLKGPYYQYDENGKENLDSSYNYRDFVLQLGANKLEGSGGLFGVGKTCYYKASNQNAVIIYTRTEYLGRIESRLIIHYFFQDIDKVDKVWIGAEKSGYASNRFPRPFLNNEADELARKFEMKSFENNETGTSILILDAHIVPDEENESELEYFKENVERKIVHWFWPKTITKIKYKSIDFFIGCNGEEKNISNSFNPKSPYFYFSYSYDKWTRKRVATSNIIPINATKSKIHVGDISFVRIDKRLIHDSEFFITKDVNVCLAYMRDVEFVVKYANFNVPGLQDEYVLGLFHTDPSSDIESGVGNVEKAFRLSENATHSDWIPNSITANPKLKSYVNIGLREISLQLNKEFGVIDDPITHGDVNSLLASKIGRLLPLGMGNTPGTVFLPDESGNSGGSSSSQSKRKIKPKLKSNEIKDIENQVREVVFTYQHDGKSELKIRISAYAIYEGGKLFDSSLIQLDRTVVVREISYKKITELIPVDNQCCIIGVSGEYQFYFKTKGNLFFNCDFEIINRSNKDE